MVEAAALVDAAETGFLLTRDPDTVRAPDVAFVARERAVGIDDDLGFVTVVPDLVGGIVSPRDSFSDVEEKVLAWLTAGTRLVIVVDPKTRTLHAYRGPDRVVVLREDRGVFHEGRWGVVKVREREQGAVTGTEPEPPSSAAASTAMGLSPRMPSTDSRHARGARVDA